MGRRETEVMPRCSEMKMNKVDKTTDTQRPGNAAASTFPAYGDGRGNKTGACLLVGSRMKSVPSCSIVFGNQTISEQPFAACFN